MEPVTLCSATLGEDRQCEPPLGPLYIAAALGELGVEVDFRDFQLCEGAHGFSGEPLARFLAGHARTVAISCFVDMLPAVVDAARRLHEADPATRIVLGGPGPTATAAQLVALYPWISAVVRGEGEESIQDWIRTTADGREVPGVTYRYGEQVVHGPERARSRALDGLPLPAYDLLDWERYTHARVITTRGCAYRCSFCDVSALWGNRTVYRGLEATVAEMELLRDTYGKTMISIADDTFVLNRNRVRDFCRLLLARRSNLQWGCFGRINLMTPDLVELMAEAGCRAVFYGIDSGSQTVLDRTVKRMRAEDVVPVLELSAQHFDTIEASFIWGYPFETVDDFRCTLELAGEAARFAPAVNVQLHMLSPLPLSPIYREFPGPLLAPEPADRRWLLLPALLLDDRAVVVREIVRARPEVYPGFYTFPTPGKQAKRESLEQVMSTLDSTVGSTLFDPRTAGLLAHDDPTVERELLSTQDNAADRIGTGLAIGYFRQIRRRATRNRGPNLVRQRS
jgi:anaerobic magnesium-protoporphyrin IX monomethyl ester cyclase